MNAALQSSQIVLAVMGRLGAGGVACLALYIGLFMYKDERDRWQNRLEQLWVDIDDRAKRTGSVFPALVNRISAGTVKILDRLFGEERFSVKLIAVSVNLSLLCAQASEMPNLYRRYWEPPVRPLHALLEVVLTILLLVAGSLAMRFQGRPSIQAGCLVPPVMYFANNFRHSFRLAHSVGWSFAVAYPLSPVFAAFMSCVVDVFALVIIRKSFTRLEEVSTSGRALLLAAVLYFVAWCACTLPLLISYSIMHIGIDYRSGLLLTVEFVSWSLQRLATFDAITYVYCVVPSVALLGLVIHRILWPSLARFTYPLLEFKVLTERKYLIAIGAMALGFALNLTTFKDFVVKFVRP
jgi:hypothetical protein